MITLPKSKANSKRVSSENCQTTNGANNRCHITFILYTYGWKFRKMSEKNVLTVSSRIKLHTQITRNVKYTQITQNVK